MKQQHDQCNVTCFSCRPSVQELILYLQNIFRTIVADPRPDPVRGWTPAVSNSAGRHLLGAANGRKLYLKIHVKIQILSFTYVFACNKSKALQPAHTYSRHGRSAITLCLIEIYALNSSPVSKT